ncbi:MAG: hypoxanthine phosphoribosyltransferase [Eubacterium sp.]|nr:hypoxanthine phosphoribosyltransferase [Eubacterium sp.]
MKSNKDIIGTILYSQKEINKRAKEIGEQISKDYKGEEVILIGTLKGAVLWMADVMKEIKLDTKIDFVAASSYGSATTSSGVVKITKDIGMDLFNKNVIIIEDIVDTGTTLKYLKEYIGARNPKSVKICTLLDKPARRKAEIEADYVGFVVDDLFIIGYGLDYDQKYRNLPYISYLEG